MPAAWPSETPVDRELLGQRRRRSRRHNQKNQKYESVHDDTLGGSLSRINQQMQKA
jgi:hypothetical protein